MKSLLTAVALVIALTGCAALDNMIATQRLATYAKTDKQLINRMYALSADGQKQGLTPPLVAAGYRLTSIYPTTLTVMKEVAQGRNLVDAVASFRSNPQDATEEAPATQYVAAIKARGNTARLYKTSLSRALAALVPQPFRHFEGDAHNPPSLELFDRQPAILEFDSTGRLVSLMLHAYQVQTSFGAGVTLYSTIYSGRDTTVQIENTIGNRLLADAFIRNL